MKYFDDITTLHALKKQYKEYCKFMHPDKGGKHVTFVEMKNQYDFLLQNWKIHKPKATKQKQPEVWDDVTDQLKAALKKELKKRKRKKVSYQTGNTIYHVDVNDFLEKMLDKLF